MSVTIDDLHHIATLAKLHLNPEAVPEYTKNLQNTLALFAELQSVDTDQIEPLAHPHEAAQRLRPDVVTEKDQSERLQQLAPAIEAGLYLVPQVIEE